MENFPSLRSLEAIGRPPGTGRPTTPPSTDPADAGQDVDHEERAERFRAAIENHERVAAEEAEIEQGRPAEAASTAPAEAEEAPQAREAPGELAASPSPEAAPPPPSLAELGGPEAPPAQAPHRHAAATRKPLAQPLPASPAVNLGWTPELAPSPLSPILQGIAKATSELAVPGQPAPPPTSPAGALDAATVALALARPALALGAAPEGQTWGGSETPPLDPLSSLPALDASRAGPELVPSTARPSEGAATLAVSASSGTQGESWQASDSPAPAHHARTGAHAAFQAADQAARILQQVRVALAPGLRQATIQLSPPSLGRVEVRIAVSEGRMRAAVRAERAETLQALAGHVPELRAALATQGIQAEHVELGLGFGAARDDARGRTRGEGTEGRTGAPMRLERIHPGELVHALARAMAAARGGVDMYA